MTLTPASATANPHDTTLHAMLATMRRTVEERGACTDVDLGAAGFTRAEIIDYAPEAARLLRATDEEAAEDKSFAGPSIYDGGGERADLTNDVGATSRKPQPQTAKAATGAATGIIPAFLILLDRDHYLIEPDADTMRRLQYVNPFSPPKGETTALDQALRLAKQASAFWTGWLTRVEQCTIYGSEPFQPTPGDYAPLGPRIRAAIDPAAIRLIADARQPGLMHLLEPEA